MIPAEYRHLPPHLPVNDAARLLGKSRRTLYNWMSRGLVEWVLSPSGQRLIVTETLWQERLPDMREAES